MSVYFELELHSFSIPWNRCSQAMKCQARLRKRFGAMSSRVVMVDYILFVVPVSLVQRAESNVFPPLLFNVIVLAGPSWDPDMPEVLDTWVLAIRNHYYYTWHSVPGSRKRIVSNGLSGGRARPSKRKIFRSANPVDNLQRLPVLLRIVT